MTNIDNEHVMLISVINFETNFYSLYGEGNDADMFGN